MMVGIDVTHPGMGTQEGTPSIAAVVASVDEKFVQFPASMRIQKAHRMKEVLYSVPFSQIFENADSCSNKDVGRARRDADREIEPLREEKQDPAAKDTDLQGWSFGGTSLVPSSQNAHDKYN